MESTIRPLWPWFVALTVLCWGAYVPTLHVGQAALGKNSALRAFLFVGLAYFLVSVAVLAYIWLAKAEPWELTGRGMALSTLAGTLGAVGALGIVFALRFKGLPIYVAPLVFAGAPIINTLVSMIWHRPARPPALWFYAGILLAGFGAALVLRFKPT
ncbi:MAG: hypothetical protein HY763_11555 [Planctomycetes bacterium]|nr:hypothetical protein [Planctomycetota bacterium]